MHETEPDRKATTVIIAVLAILGVASFIFAGIAAFENSAVTATSSSPPAPLSRG
jgi:hypothetical protein